MAQNYTRQSTLSDGDTITASLFNDEYNQLVNAFTYSSTSASSTGHRHDGSAGQGGNIFKIGDLDFLNKIEVDSTNNRWGFYVEVSSAAVEQIRIQDGAIVPVTTNDIDLGTSSLQFKDLYIDGTANVDSLTLTSGATVTTILDEDDLSSDSATALVTQQSVKAYVDSQVTAQDLDFQADTGGALSIDLDSETLTFTGGTGIDTSGSGNAVTFAIDSTVATLTGSQTLTNKTLTSPVLNTGVSGTAVLDEDDMSSNSATQLATQQSIKAYVDSQVGANNELSEILANGNTTGGTNIVFGDSASVSDDRLVFGAGSDLQIYHSGTHSYIDDAGTGNLTLRGNASVRVEKYEGEILADFAADGAVSLYHDNSVKIATTSTGVNVTGTVKFDGLSGTGSVNVTDILDQDDMSSNSATALATQQSIKAYVDSQVATVDTLAEVLGNGNTTGGTDIAVGTGDDITFADSSKAIFGAGSDLQIYHDGSASYIDDQGTGSIIIKGTNFAVNNSANSQTMIAGNDGADVKLFYAGANKLATTSTGIDVTGVITTDGMTTSADINFGDNDKAVFGAGSDLQIYHSGSDSFIVEGGTGGLKIDSNYTAIRSANGSETSAKFLENGAVELYHDNSQKLATTSTGIDVTGSVTADGLTVQTVQGNIEIANSSAIIDMQRAGTNYIYASNASGNLRLGSGGSLNRLNITSGGDISFYEDTGTTAKFFWDASEERLGIGTSSPDTTLEVAAPTTTNVDVAHFSNSNGAVKAKFHLAATTGDGQLTLYDGNNNADVLISSVGNSYINSGGNVGIGTSSPSQLLEISGADAPAIRLNDTTYNQYAEISTANAGSLILKADVGNGGTGSTYIGFEVDGANEAMRIDSSGTLITKGAATFNEDSADVDFRVESDTNTHALFVDGGTGNVLMSTSTIAYAGTALNIGDTSDSQNGVQITTSTTGNGYILFGDGSGADAYRGQIQYEHTSDKLTLRSGGVIRQNLSGTETVFNDTSTDTDFRVESDAQANMLVVDAAENKVGINRTPNISNSKLEVGGADNVPIFNVEASGNTGGMGVGSTGLQLFSGSTSIFRLNSGGASLETGTLYVPQWIEHSGDSNTYFGFPDGDQFKIVTGNTGRLHITGSEMVITEGGEDKDFRVESNGNSHMLFVDAGNDAVGIGGSPVSTSQLTVKSGADANLLLDGESYSTWVQDAQWNSLLLGGAYWDSGAKYAVTSRGASQIYIGHDGDATPSAQGFIFSSAPHGNAGNSPSFENLASLTRAGTVFNEDSKDRDFRVESDSNSTALFMDASLSYVGINRSPAVELDIKRVANATPVRIGSEGGEGRGIVFADVASSTTKYNFFVGAQQNHNNTFEITPSTVVGGYTFTNVALAVDENSSVVVNQTGVSTADFRVESTNRTHALFVDAGLDGVGICNSAVEYMLDVGADNNAYASGRTMRINSSGDTIFSLSKAGQSLFSMRNNTTLYTALSSNNSADLMLGYGTGDAGAINDHLRFTSTETIVNNDGADRDFRVESDNKSNAFTVDAATDQVCIGRGANSAASADVVTPFGTYGLLLESTDATVANNEYVDITINTGGGGYQGMMVVANTVKANAGARTQSLLFVAGRGTDGVANVVSTDTGSGAASFTVTFPSNGVARVTNTSGSTTAMTVQFLGGQSF